MPLLRFVLPAAALSLLTPLPGCHRDSSGTSAVDAGPPLPPITSATKPAHAVPISPEAIEAMVNPSKLPPYTGPTGSVEGTIRIDGPAAPDVSADFSACPGAASEYGKVFREGASDPTGARVIADAVVVVAGYSGFIPERREAMAVKITGCGLEARTIAMTFGQRLEIANVSTQYWAPTLDQASLPALMIAPPNGDAVKLYPPKPGRYTLSDMMRHTYARTDVLVLLQPLHAVTDLDGHYRIDGVPVGKANVSAHVPALGDIASAASIDVIAGVVQKVDLVVHYTARAPDAPLLHGTASDAGVRPKPVLR